MAAPGWRGQVGRRSRRPSPHRQRCVRHDGDAAAWHVQHDYKAGECSRYMHDITVENAKRAFFDEKKRIFVAGSSWLGYSVCVCMNHQCRPKQAQPFLTSTQWVRREATGDQRTVVEAVPEGGVYRCTIRVYDHCYGLRQPSTLPTGHQCHVSESLRDPKQEYQQSSTSEPAGRAWNRCRCHQWVG